MKTSPLFTRITSFCAKHTLIMPTDTVVVGFSGGPDSLFLLHALATWLPPEHIIAAHLDHGWRNESKNEAIWCQQVATSLGVQFVAGHLQDYSSTLKERGSQEDSARQARRHFFKKVAEQFNAQKIALAHHADDQLETFFIRLIRGTGVQGLASMRPQQGMYIRPLLEFSKDEIIAFLSEHNITYIVDPSNASHDYLRNRIRHSLMPALTTCDARAEKNIHAAITHLQEIDDYLDAQARATFASLKTEVTISLSNNTSESFSLKLPELELCHPLIRHRILVLWLCSAQTPFTPTKAFFAEIERFLFQSRTSSNHQIAPKWFIYKKRGTARLLYSQ